MKNILIVEDSKTISNIIKKELLKLEFNVKQAFTYKEASQQIIDDSFDLIVLDLHLPDGEGSELIANIKSLTKTKVVVLTSEKNEDLREELFGYGILDYITKDTNLFFCISEIVKIINRINDKNKQKILIIDDSNFICKQIRTVLEPRGYEIQSASNAKDGLYVLKNYDFNLLILDMELPDMHGLKVLETIRKDARFLSLPIIVLSGSYTPDIVRDALKNGASDFLKKPFVYEEFVLKIDLWIDYYKAQSALEEKTMQLKFVNENLENLVIKKVEELREKDKMLIQQSRHAQMGEMIAMIAHQWRQPLNAINAGVTLMEQKSKLNKLDLKTTQDISKKLRRYIHYLSSTIDDFRNFFRPEKEMRLTNLDTITQKAISLTKSSIQASSIILNYEVEDAGAILTHENELVQVVINILKNAQDVLNEKIEKNKLITIKIQDAVLKICDNGGGIPQDIVGKIFNPYFSTKSLKDGTGLGLYMSKIIVEEHCGGVLSVENAQEGACFSIDMSNAKDYSE